MKFEQTLLGRIKKKNKLLFFGILSFMMVNLLFTIVRVESTPFYVWSMFSDKIQNRDTLEIYQLEYNQGQLYNLPQIWNHHRRLVFLYTSRYYDYCVNNENQDPVLKKLKYYLQDSKSVFPRTNFDKYFTSQENLVNYPDWLLSYIDSQTHDKIDSIKVYKSLLKLNSHYEVELLEKRLLFHADSGENP